MAIVVDTYVYASLQKTNGLEKQKNGALSFRKYQTEEI
jgi:hypothetical protein